MNVYDQIEDFLAKKLGREPTTDELNEFLEWLQNHKTWRIAQ